MAQTANFLLRSLSAPLLNDVLSHTHAVSLGARDVLYEPNIAPYYAYFLTSGVASVAIEGTNGTTVNVEMIGCEALVCGVHLLGPSAVPSLCSMQLSGGALRMTMSTLREMFLDSAELRGRVLEFVQMQAATLGQIAGCNRMHTVEQRLARLLLMLRDRVGDDTLLLTQEYLAEVLGTQRTTVSGVAAALQARDLIEYTRGRLRIVDRRGLEKTACGCYAVARDLLRGLYRTEDRTEDRAANRANRQNYHAIGD